MIFDVLRRSIGSSIASILSIFTIPLFAIFIGPDEILNIQLVTYFGAFASSLFLLRIEYVIPATFSRDERIDLIIASTLWHVIWMLFLVCATLYFWEDVSYSEAYSEKILIAAIFFGLLTNLSANLQQFYNSEEKYLVAGLLDTAFRVSSILIFFSLICVNDELVYLVFVFAKFVQFILSILPFINLGRQFNNNIQRSAVKRGMQYNLSQFLMNMSGILILTILTEAVMPGELALYLLANTLLYGPVALMSRSFSEVFLAKSGQKHLTSKNILKTYLQYSLIFILFGILFIFVVNSIPPDLLMTIFGEKWNGLSDVLNIVAFSAAANLVSAAFDKVLILRDKLSFSIFYNLVRLLVVWIIFLLFLDDISDMEFLKVVWFFVYFQIAIYFVDWIISGVVLSYTKNGSSGHV